MRRVAIVISSLVLGMLAAIPASAAPFPSEIPLPNGFQPEGIAIGRGDTFYVGSISTGAIYSGSLRTGTGDILVPPREGRAAIGLDVDHRNRLFVAGGGTGDAYVYDGATGEELAAYDFADGGTFVNDVVVTGDSAWFTDSFRPVLYRVPIAPNGTLGDQSDVETVPVTGDFDFVDGAFNLNGIDATPNAKHLVVVQSVTGLLFHVDPDTGEATEIALADGESVVAGDGILLEGKQLYVVQNQLNLVARVDLAPDLASGEVVGRTTDLAFDVPTTVDRFGNGLYLVNARFGIAEPENADFSIVRIPRP